MRPLLLQCIFILVLFSSCNWVNDDLSDCPSGTWVKISYTYNIFGVDAAPSQVGNITILAFDKDGKYVGKLEIDSITLHQGFCMAKLPFAEGVYNLTIWGGADGNTYQSPPLIAGKTERKSHYQSLVCNNENHFYKKLNGLFHCNLENVNISNDYQVLTADLMKDTNYFSCILQDESNAPIHQEDFEFILESANGIIDYSNTPSSTDSVCYYPYEQNEVLLSEQVPVVYAKMNTLRIMKNDQTKLIIKHIPSGKNILRIPLTQYLLISKIYNNKGEMEDQEYLDRQDSYTLLFFIKSTESGIPQICPILKVGDWIIRLDEPELESRKLIASK